MIRLILKVISTFWYINKRNLKQPEIYIGVTHKKNCIQLKIHPIYYAEIPIIIVKYDLGNALKESVYMFGGLLLKFLWY